MSEDQKICQNCAASLPADSPGGLCPACLMGGAMDLLAGQASAVSFSEEVTVPTTTAPGGRDALEGSTLGAGGRYKILQRIGEGGFGTVFMAEQSEPVRRRVAIKVLKAGMDTRQVVARFEAERQALAMMDHPNIAKVFDGGETEQGRPYFVMELVRGVPITEFCDEESLDTDRRLKLFLQVCRAVQHAHQKGIIHRDLKPSNVLVTVEDGAEPVPKVIDFGVAKATEAQLTDKTLFTRFEQMVGTPAYMSPEQAGARAAHDIDTRADIYALGVLLYELLTGTTPIEASTLQNAAFEEVRRILREEEAPRPSARLSSLEQERRTTVAKSRGTESVSLGKQLRGDLDWIVMRAIEKDRRRRYETANALAQDVERHLEDEPVLASPPTFAYRSGKFLRRHRVGVGIAAMLVVSLVGGLALAGIGFAEARGEARKAREAEQLAREAERKAQNEAEKAEAINEFLVVDLLRSNTEINVAPNLTMRQALDRAAESVASRFVERPLIRAEIHRVLRDAYRALGADEESLDHAKNAFLLLEKRLGPEARETLSAKRAYAAEMGLVHRENTQEAQRILQEVLDTQRRVLGLDHENTIATMYALAGATWFFRSKGVRIVREYLEAFATKFPGDIHGITMAKRLLVSALLNLDKNVHHPEIEMLCTEIMEHAEHCSELPNVCLLDTWEVVAGFYEVTGRLDEAEDLRRSSVSKAETLWGADSANVALDYYNLGWLVSQRGKIAEGEHLLRRALKLHLKHQPGRLDTRARWERGLAEILVRDGRRDEAIAILAQSIDEMRTMGKRKGGWLYRETKYLETVADYYEAHVDLKGVESIFRPIVEGRIEDKGFEAVNGSQKQLLVKARFLEAGEDGVRVLLQELAQHSEIAISPNRMEAQVQAGIQGGTLHGAKIAARLGEWSKARNLFDRWQGLGGRWGEIREAAGYGAVLLKLGENDSYEQHCMLMRDKFGDSSDGLSLDLTAILILLDPRSERRAEHLKATELAQRSMKQRFAEHGPKNYSVVNCLARGLAEYRAKNMSAVAAALDGAVQGKQPKIQTPMYALLAMAAKANGEDSLAREHLARAENLNGEKTIWSSKGEKWFYTLVADLVLEEARMVVRSAAEDGSVAK